MGWGERNDSVYLQKGCSPSPGSPWPLSKTWGTGARLTSIHHVSASSRRSILHQFHDHCIMDWVLEDARNRLSLPMCSRAFPSPRREVEANTPLLESGVAVAHLSPTEHIKGDRA